MLPLSRIGVKDAPLQRWIDTVVQVVRELQNPLARGVLLEGLILTTGSENVINHGLPRKARGWIIVDCDQTFEDTPKRVKSSEKLSSQLVLYIPASASSTVTTSVWVF